MAQLKEKKGMLEKDISASKPKLHGSRGEGANADREKLQAEVKSFRLRDEGCAEQDEDNSWLHQ